MSHLVRVSGVEALEGYRVRLRLTNGDVVDRDLAALLGGPVLAPLRDRRVFEQVHVQEGTLVWPGELDVAPETLIWDGPDPDDPGARPPAFLEPRDPRMSASHP